MPLKKESCPKSLSFFLSADQQQVLISVVCIYEQIRVFLATNRPNSVGRKLWQRGVNMLTARPGKNAGARRHTEVV